MAQVIASTVSQKQINFGLISLAVIMLVSFGYIEIKSNFATKENNTDQVQKIEKFHLGLRQTTGSLSPLPHDRMKVSAVDIMLYDAIKNVQNQYFDMVLTNNITKDVIIDIWVPDDVLDADLSEFKDYQALNYAHILSELTPNQYLILNMRYKRMGVLSQTQYLRKYKLQELKAINAYEQSKIQLARIQ